jgi:aspartyl aminopeptidase
LIDAVAAELECTPEQIRDFELCLYDTQPAQLGGLNQEFIFSRALDNLMMSFVCTRALIESSTDELLADADECRVVVLFDNEEIGSTSEHGANSVYFQSVLERINESLNGHSVTDMQVRGSVCACDLCAYIFHSP